MVKSLALVFAGWMAFVLGHLVTYKFLIVKLVLLAVARVLP